MHPVAVCLQKEIQTFILSKSTQTSFSWPWVDWNVQLTMAITLPGLLLRMAPLIPSGSSAPHDIDVLISILNGDPDGVGAAILQPHYGCGGGDRGGVDHAVVRPGL